LGRALKNTLLIVISCLVALLIAEAAIRIFAPRVLIKPLGIVLDKDLIYRLPPNASGAYGKQDGEWYMHVSINSHGLRDREIPYKRKPGVFRILGLGDSMTFAEGVELNEIYLKRLEASLKKSFPVEVINGAVRGWGPGQELAFLSKEAYRYHPDMTLIAFYSGNDFQDALHGNLYRVKNGEAVHQQVNEENSVKYRYYKHQHMIQSLPLYNWFMSHSHLANLLRQIYPHLAIEHIYRRKKDHKENFQSINTTEEAQSWTIVKAIYEKLFHMHKQTGKLFVILLPTYTEVKQGNSPRIDRMVALCKQWNIPFLNMLDGFRKQVEMKNNLDELYFPIERHFAMAGHILIAHLLEKRLRKERLLPAINRN